MATLIGTKGNDHILGLPDPDIIFGVNRTWYR